MLHDLFYSGGSALHAQSRYYVLDIFGFRLQPMIDMCLYDVCLINIKEIKLGETKRFVYTVIMVTKTQLA